MKKEKFYISTAIAYTSAKPHIGNTYEIVLADVIARYKRLKGFDVYFQTGTDEHGEKIELKAKDAGIEPQEYVDKIFGMLLILVMINLLELLIKVMRSKFRKYLRNFMIKVIFIRESTEDYIVLLVNHFGQRVNWSMVSVLTVVEK